MLKYTCKNSKGNFSNNNVKPTMQKDHASLKKKKSALEMVLKGLQAVNAVMIGLHRHDRKKDSEKQAC